MPQDSTKLISLGTRLAAARLQRNEPQLIFAARIGVSVPTLRKMESGDPGIAIGHWVAALQILDHGNDFDALLPEKKDLFARYENMNLPVRKRARRNVS